MNSFYRTYHAIRYTIDIPVIIVCYLISVYLFHFFSTEPIQLNSNYFLITAIFAWYLAAKFARLYAERRYSKFSEEIISVVYTLILFFICLTSFLYLINKKANPSIYFLIILFLLLFFFITSIKYLLRKFLHRLFFKGKFYEKVILVGSTPTAVDFYETVKLHFYYGYKCIGLLGDSSLQLDDCNYYGNLENLNKTLIEEKPDEVIITLPSTDFKKIQSCIEICDINNVKTRIIPDVYQYKSTYTQISNIGLIPVVNLKALPLDNWENKFSKRSADIIISFLFLLFIGSWLIPLLSLLIRLSSKGPAIFKQERWGLNNKKFILYKFRSMHRESFVVDENGNFKQTTKNDPRVTKVGRFLRKTSLDEIPQFWNVLIGEMALVGPRPHAIPMNLESMYTIDNYMLRHLVKPGITGLAQVNGCRGETKTEQSLQKRINYDLLYIHKWTMWLDFQIMLQTIIILIIGDENAF